MIRNRPRLKKSGGSQIYNFDIFLFNSTFGPADFLKSIPLFDISGSTSAAVFKQGISISPITDGSAVLSKVVVEGNTLVVSIRFWRIVQGPFPVNGKVIIISFVLVNTAIIST